MKVLTIGRSEDCNIVIDDNQDLISRKHAMLRIYPMGKMELVSMGRNGTFVNGLPIKNNIPIKITRKDIVSFAHVKQLDWTVVPNPYRVYHISAIIIAALIALLSGYCLWSNRIMPSPVVPMENGGGQAPVVAPDTTNRKQEEAKSQESDFSKSQVDSFLIDMDKQRKKVQADSIKKAKAKKENPSKVKKQTEDSTKTKPIKQVF